MLIQRIITGSILAAIILFSAFKSDEYLSIVIGILTLAGAWEWAYLAGIDSPIRRAAFVVLTLLPMVGIHLWTYFLEFIAVSFDWAEVRNYSGIIEWLVVPPVLFWIVMMFIIRRAPEGILNVKLKINLKLVTGWFVLVATWMFLIRLRALYGAEMTIYYLILVWMADIAAYFVGRRFGKTKLSPEISPGKTVEGMYGAIASGVICAIVLSVIYRFPIMIASDFVLLSALTVLISIYGDLFFSVVKRQRGVKDSGTILPGHGGVLDRIDSSIAASPFFYAGVLLIHTGIFS